MKVKINAFYKEGLSEGGNGSGIKVSGNKEIPLSTNPDSMNPGVSEEKIKEYAQQVLKIINESKEFNDELSESFKGMANNVLQDPENVKKILGLITSKRDPNQKMSLEDLKNESNIKFQVLSMHANVVNNVSLKTRLRTILSEYNSGGLNIIRNTHKELNDLIDTIKS